MAKAWVFAFLLLLICPLFVPFVYGQEGNGEPVDKTKTVPSTVFRVVGNYYVPLKVMFFFPFTQNYSLGHVRMLGESVYSLSITPTSLIFSTNESDTFRFAFDVGYATSSAKAIIVGIQTNFKIQEYSMPFPSNKVQIQVDITTERFPQIPTGESIAMILFSQQKREFGDWTNAIKDAVEIGARNDITISGILVGVIFSVAIMGLFISYSLKNVWRKRY